MCFCKYITFNLYMRKLSYWTSWERLKPPFGSPHFKNEISENENCSATRHWKRISWNRIMFVVSYWICQDITPFWKTVFLGFLANLGVLFVGDLNHSGTPGFLQSALSVAQFIAWSQNVGSIVAWRFFGETLALEDSLGLIMLGF